MSMSVKMVPLVIFLLQLHMPVRGQEAAGPHDPQSHPASAKLHIHRGGIDDVEAIGHRKLLTGLDWYSIDKEIALGKQEAQALERDFNVLHDPSASEYIERIGQTLVLNSDATIPFTFKIIESNEINCFALPGGYVYVTSGVLAAAENEAELVGVVANCIAHVAARHPTRMLTRIDIANVLSVPVIFNDSLSNSYADHKSIAPPLTFFRFSREFAKEADYLAIQYMYKAGYAPSGFVTFLEKLKAQEVTPATKMPVAFATHPAAAARIEHAQKEIARILPARDHSIVNTPEFNRIKNSIKNRVKTDRVTDAKSCFVVVSRFVPKFFP